ncbi:MAG: sulfotransferase [Opitutales bacterium]
MSLQGKTLLLGIGAQKTGSSWLAQYFLSHPQVLASPMKAFHFFDLAFSPVPEERAHFRRRALQNLAQEATSLAKTGTLDNAQGEAFAKLRALIDGARLLYESSAYLDYYRREIQTERVFADMSPAYQLLPPETFARMHHWHERVKFLFVMRDPVDRHLSQCWYDARARGETLRAQTVLANLDDRTYFERSNYVKTLESLDEAGVPETDCLVLFFEKLFTEPTMRRVCAYLGVDYLPAACDTSHNATVRHKEFDQSVLQHCRDRFSFVYEYVYARYKSHVPTSWANAAHCCS